MTVEMKEKLVPWNTSPKLWEKLKPLARQMRNEPTAAEKLLWERLRDQQIKGFNFRRQHAIDRFIVDFYCAKARLVIEVDGPIHEYTPAEDAVRQEFLESLGLRICRFTNEEIFGSLESAIVKIVNTLPTSVGA